MIDIAVLRNDPGLVRRTVQQRGADVDVDRVVEIEAQLRDATARATRLRGQQRRLPMHRPQAGLQPADLESGELRSATEEVRALQEQYDELCGQLPNLLAADTPPGRDADGNVELCREGDPAAADDARGYHLVGTALGILGTGPGDAHEPAARWQGDGARLVQAVFAYTQHVLQARGFTLADPPDRPEGLLTRYGGQILDGAGLPIRVSACCPDRTVEQLVVCRPEDSAERLDECRRHAEELLRGLELPYRVVRVCAGALQAAEYQSYQTEAWFPGAGAYRRTHSVADLTGYQARRLRIRFLDRGRLAQPYTVRATGVTDRAVQAVLENHVQPDGSVRVPAALREHLDGQAVLEPSS